MDWVTPQTNLPLNDFVFSLGPVLENSASFDHVSTNARQVSVNEQQEIIPDQQVALCVTTENRTTLGLLKDPANQPLLHAEFLPFIPQDPEYFGAPRDTTTEAFSILYQLPFPRLPDAFKLAPANLSPPQPVPFSNNTAISNSTIQLHNTQRQELVARNREDNCLTNERKAS